MLDENIRVTLFDVNYLPEIIKNEEQRQKNEAARIELFNTIKEALDSGQLNGKDYILTDADKENIINVLKLKLGFGVHIGDDEPIHDENIWIDTDEDSGIKASDIIFNDGKTLEEILEGIDANLSEEKIKEIQEIIQTNLGYGIYIGDDEPTHHENIWIDTDDNQKINASDIEFNDGKTLEEKLETGSVPDNIVTQDDLTNYIKITDYPDFNKTGGIKVNSAYGLAVLNNGTLLGFTRTYNQYLNDDKSLIICKQTLENVLTGKNLTNEDSFKTINGESIVGSGNIEIQGGSGLGTKIVVLSQSEYDALTEYDEDTLYHIYED